MKFKTALSIIGVLALLALMVFAAVTPAHADGGWTAPGNSQPGITRYVDTASNPNPNAQCGTGAGSGAFGYFGKGNNLAGGADGRQTGINNSSVCGNRP